MTIMCRSIIAFFHLRRYICTCVPPTVPECTRSSRAVPECTARPVPSHNAPLVPCRPVMHRSPLQSHNAPLTPCRPRMHRSPLPSLSFDLSLKLSRRPPDIVGRFRENPVRFVRFVSTHSAHRQTSLYDIAAHPYYG